MVGSLNKVTLIGNVGKDPEVRITQEGKEILTFSLATTETWKNKHTGERREKTEWHRVVVFIPALVNIVKNYAVKGTRLYVEGSLQTREWNDQSGIKKYTTEIVLQTHNSSIILLGSKPSYTDNHTENKKLKKEEKDADDYVWGVLP
ncbi:single-stranded DNA-binding protein [Candidatus Bandiella euplotis]|uniref:Single-stranded DNA-binding protein n=1 Tax=Candidatus Bandiella euplotis TaxID=1664265 RepID=A0ABZ0ULX0_9RICK|nr:Single-stranded DNA-binding protein [Candidatus Bandiella woodruffii]